MSVSKAAPFRLSSQNVSTSVAAQGPFRLREWVGVLIAAPRAME